MYEVLLMKYDTIIKSYIYDNYDDAFEMERLLSEKYTSNLPNTVSVFRVTVQSIIVDRIVAPELYGYRFYIRIPYDEPDNIFLELQDAFCIKVPMEHKWLTRLHDPRSRYHMAILFVTGYTMDDAVQEALRMIQTYRF